MSVIEPEARSGSVGGRKPSEFIASDPSMIDHGHGGTFVAGRYGVPRTRVDYSLSEPLHWHSALNQRHIGRRRHLTQFPPIANNSSGEEQKYKTTVRTLGWA